MTLGQALYPALAVMCLASRTTAADPATVRLHHDAAAFEERGQLQKINYIKDRNVLELYDMLLIEDDAPGIGKPEGAADRSWFEKLGKGVMIRKDIVLEDPRAFSGCLVFNGLERIDNDYPLHISINGHHFLRPPTKKAHPSAIQYYSRDWPDAFDSWFFVEIPTGAFRKGVNECILWADSDEPSWQIMIAADSEYRRGSTIRTHHPNRSAKSVDGGSTWDFEHLGWKNEIDGEYAIRLSLDRYVPEGVYISPVIDLVEEWSAPTIRERAQLRNCRIAWEIELPEGTKIEISARLGDNPVPASSSWSAYERIRGFSGIWASPPGRYLQFKVVMKTHNPLVTPSLRGISTEITVEKIPRDSNVFHRIVEFRNGCVIRPSVEFTHEDFMKMREYRERFELDRVVAGARSEFEAQIKLMRWAYEIPIDGLDPYAWNYYDLPNLERDADGNIRL